MRIKQIIAGLVLSLVFCGSALATETIVFEGTPRFKGVSTPTDSFNEKLEGEKRRSSELIITKEGDTYYWLSREKKPLRYFKSGGFHYFVRTDHSDFIKIVPAPNSEEAEQTVKFLYMESISDGMKGTINYWGGAEKFEL